MERSLRARPGAAQKGSGSSNRHPSIDTLLSAAKSVARAVFVREAARLGDSCSALRNDAELTSCYVNVGRGRLKRTTLMFAARAGKAARATQLLAAGADVDARTSSGFTALLLACYRWPKSLPSAGEGRTQVVRALLDAGADIHARDPDHLTPLHWASRQCNAAIVGLLLDRGAALEARDKRAWSPLYHACEAGNPATVPLLLERGADVAARDELRAMALHGAAGKGHAAIVALLLDAGADVDARDAYGNTPLHSTCHFHCDSLDAARALLDRGADVDARTTTFFFRRKIMGRETPLYNAATMAHHELALLLLARGADPNARTASGYSPLFTARLQFADDYEDEDEDEGYADRQSRCAAIAEALVAAGATL